MNVINGHHLVKGDRVRIKADIANFPRNNGPSINDEMSRMGGTECIVEYLDEHIHFQYPHDRWSWISDWLELVNSSTTQQPEVKRLKEEKKQKEIAKKIVKVSFEIHNLLTRRISKRQYYSSLHLLGVNKEGVCVESIMLRAYGGCHDMPEITHNTFSKAYITLAKMNLVPSVVARAYYMHYGDVNNWGQGEGGDLLENYPGTTFITYTKNKVGAGCMSKNGQFHEVEYQVVKTKYKMKGGEKINGKRENQRSVRSIDSTASDLVNQAGHDHREVLAKQEA